jgi:uncharacterized repeat protein (TIGR03803 family)
MNSIQKFLLAAIVLASALHRAGGAVTVEAIYFFGHNTNDNGGNPLELMQAADGNLYGTTQSGGNHGHGTVFRITTNGALTTLFAFDGTNGDIAMGRLVQDANGVLYGTSTYGGVNDDGGTIFKITTNGVFTSLVLFTNDSVQPHWPSGGLTLASDGRLYGTTAYGGGSNAFGTLFVMNTNGALTTLAAFDGTNGMQPSAALVQAADGNLYGTTAIGGTWGTVFRATTNGALTLLFTFGSTNGAYPQSLVQGQDGNLYGITSEGGPGFANGIVFRITTGGAFTLLCGFTNATAGSRPSSFLQGADGNLFGTTYFGGTNNGSGTIFRVTTNGILTSLHSFNDFEGSYPRALVQGRDGNYYGVTAATGFGTNGNGTVFKLTTNGTLSTLYSYRTFSSTDGVVPRKPVPGANGLFYGIAQFGGEYGYGAIFSITTNGTMKRLYSFTGGNDGNSPTSLLFARDGMLYGTTGSGGSHSDGTVFRMTTNGALTTIYTFLDGVDGSNPDTLLQGIDNDFYGTTYNGGTASVGAIYRVSSNGTFTTIHSFNGTSDGTRPNTLLQRNDGTFYGSAFPNIPDSGTIFKLTPAGAFTTLHVLGPDDGYDITDLVAGSDGNLYGTSEHGGDSGNGFGVFFRITTNGVFTPLHTFTNEPDCSRPSGLVQGSDGNFYGTTYEGGPGDNGTLFRAKTNGGFAILHYFGGYTDGNSPIGLVQGKELSFYGAAVGGGQYSGGTFYRVSVPLNPSIATQPSNATNHAGANATFTVEADGVLPLKYQWRKNLTNLVDGGNISGATSATLVLNNISAADAASFSVVVTNNYGSVTSSNAMLTILPSLPDALDATNLVWTTGGDANWFGQPWITHDGVDAAESGFILHWEESWKQTIVNGPGQLSFWWKVSSEGGYDFLNFYVNGLLTSSISGETGWLQASFNLPPGSQSLLWDYEKDFNISLGADRAWVDQVTFVPTPPPAPVFQPVVRSNNTLALAWSTVAGRLYQVQYSTNLTQTNWLNLGSPGTNGSLSVIIGPDPRRFYRIRVLP